MIRVGGQLSNAGRLTSNADLTLEAGAIEQHGTLGMRKPDHQYPDLINDRGLIFSGGDMTLSVGNFTNQNGDLYGVGERCHQGQWLGAGRPSVEHLRLDGKRQGLLDRCRQHSPTVLRAPTGHRISVWDRTLISGSITVQCLDCRGDHL